MWTTKPPLNLQKQVYKNQDDIETLQDTHFVEGGFNMTAVIKYKEASLTELQAHTAANETLGTFGMVGDVLYVVAKTGDAEQTWKELGKFPDVGPQGPKGDKGDTGATGAKGDNGLDALVWEGGVFYTRDNVAIGATVNMGPTSSFNRTPVAGDTYNVLLTQRDENDAEIASYFCQLKITQVVGGAFMSEITNLTKATGTDGVNGLPALTYSGTITTDTKPQNGHTFSWAPMFSSNFNRTPVVGDVLNVLVNYNSNSDSYMCTVEVSEYAFPALKGTYVNVTQATGKVGDTINLAENQSLTIGNEVQIKNEEGRTVLNLDVTGTDSFQFKIGDEPATYHQHINGDNIITDQAPGAMWSYANGYYEITGVPTSSKSGTLPNDNGWTYLTTYPQKLRILFNKEFYQFADNQHTNGTLVFSHMSYEGVKLIIKTITITIATRGWVLTRIGTPRFITTYKYNSELWSFCVTLPTTTNNAATLSDALGNTVTTLPASGWLKDGNNYYPIMYIITSQSVDMYYLHPTEGAKYIVGPQLTSVKKSDSVLIH